MMGDDEGPFGLVYEPGAIIFRQDDLGDTMYVIQSGAAEYSYRQGAKALELRAAISLGRLWLGQGKTFEARDMLAEVHGWFAEGFDTADLKDAKALLEALSAVDVSCSGQQEKSVVSR